MPSLGRSSLRRGAWIETSSIIGRNPESLVAPLSGGGRGLKPAPGSSRCLLTGVAPLSGGGRGLKQDRGCECLKLGRRSSLRRGAWIETEAAEPSAEIPEVAPLSGGGRGLKHCARARQCRNCCVAPLSGGGRGLKRHLPHRLDSALPVAPLSGGGRGLKQRSTSHRPKPYRVAPLSGGGRGLKPRGLPDTPFDRKSLLSPEGGVD